MLIMTEELHPTSTINWSNAHLNTPPPPPLLNF